MKPANKLSKEESARFEALQEAIRKGFASFVEVGSALVEISDKRLYREKYSTFDQYCEAEWKMTARHAYRMCQAAEVVKALPEKCDQLVANESSARALAKVPEAKRAEVIEKAAAKGKVTAKAIKEAAKPAEPVKPAKVTQDDPIEVSASLSFDEPNPDKTPCQLIIDGLKNVISLLESYEKPAPTDEWGTVDLEEVANILLLAAKNVRKLDTL